MQLSLFPTYGQEDSPVKTSQWHEWARELGLEGPDLDSFMNLLAYLEEHVPEFSSSRTFQVSSLATEDGISDSSFERWPNSGMAWGGVCSTAATSVSPSHATESTLSGVIETGEVPQKYFLSPNAAVGMLRRANQMGRPLFPPLRRALEILSKAQSTSE